MDGFFMIFSKGSSHNPLRLKWESGSNFDCVFFDNSELPGCTAPAISSQHLSFEVAAPAISQPLLPVERGEKVLVAMATFRWIMQLHKDVPKAAQFYSQGLDFNINVCTLRWAELQSGPLKLALMQSNSDHAAPKQYSSLLSFTVTDINCTITKLMSLGAELDGPIRYEIHGKVAAVRCIDGHMLGLHEPA